MAFRAHPPQHAAVSNGHGGAPRGLGIAPTICLVVPLRTIARTPSCFQTNWDGRNHRPGASRATLAVCLLRWLCFWFRWSRHAFCSSHPAVLVSWVPRLATPAESPGEFASAISRASLRLCQFSPIPPLRLSGLCMGPKREKYGLELAPRDGPTRVTATALDWLALCRGALPAVANGRVSIPPLPSHPAVGKQRVALSKGLLPAAPRIGCIWPEAHPPRSGDARRACGAGCRM